MKELSKKRLLDLEALDRRPERRWPDRCREAAVLDPDVIRPIDAPYDARGGIAVLRGNLAPGRGGRQTVRRRSRDDAASRAAPACSTGKKRP